MKKIIILVLAIFIVLIIIVFVLKSNSNSINKMENSKSVEVQEPLKQKESFRTIKPATFCLYNSLPYNSEDSNEILRKVPSLKDKTVFADGHVIEFSELAQIIGMGKPYYLKISKDKLSEDKIVKYLATENAINGEQYIDYYGSGDEEITYNDIFIINIDNDYLSKHKVSLNGLNEFKDSVMEQKVLHEAVRYIEKNHNPPDFISKSEEIADIKQEIIENYNLKLYQIGEMPWQKFFIASFEPKIDDFPFTHFSFFYLEQSLEKFGFHFGYVSFTIDDQWYLGYTNCVTPGSGHVGKELYMLENGKLRHVTCDYSRAD